VSDIIPAINVGSLRFLRVHAQPRSLNCAVYLCVEGREYVMTFREIPDNLSKFWGLSDEEVERGLRAVEARIVNDEPTKLYVVRLGDKNPARFVINTCPELDDTVYSPMSFSEARIILVVVSYVFSVYGDGSVPRHPLEGELSLDDLDDVTRGLW
jgi:hypothetical protein